MSNQPLFIICLIAVIVLFVKIHFNASVVQPEMMGTWQVLILETALLTNYFAIY